MGKPTSKSEIPWQADGISEDALLLWARAIARPWNKTTASDAHHDLARDATREARWSFMVDYDVVYRCFTADDIRLARASSRWMSCGRSGRRNIADVLCGKVISIACDQVGDERRRVGRASGNGASEILGDES